MHNSLLAGIVSKYRSAGRTIITALIFSALLTALTGCGHEHKWAEATCTEPKTCTECGKTEGEPLGHKWKEATCTEAKTCSVCGETEGEPLGHKWKEATCTEAKTCSVCGETEGEPLGHKWQEATCTKPKTCSVCGATEGEPSGHVVEDWEITKEPTCTETGTREGTCTVCGQTVSEEVPATGHTPGEDWEIIEEATSTSAGTRAKVCVNCGEQLETESYELSEEEKEEAYKDECESYSYEEIARDPDDYKGDKAKFTGKVVQVMQEGNTYTLRVNITKTRWGYDDTILVYYEAQKGASRILEDDIVTMYGMLGGTYTYKTVIHLLYRCYMPNTYRSNDLKCFKETSGVVCPQLWKNYPRGLFRSKGLFCWLVFRPAQICRLLFTH